MAINTENFTGPVGLFQFLNEQTVTSTGLPVFGISLLLLITAVIFLSLKDYTTPKAFAPAFLVGFILSVVFWQIGILPILVVYIYALALMVTIVALRSERR